MTMSKDVLVEISYVIGINVKNSISFKEGPSVNLFQKGLERGLSEFDKTLI